MESRTASHRRKRPQPSSRPRNSKFRGLLNVCTYDIRVPKSATAMGIFVRGVKSGAAPKGYEVQVDHYDVKIPPAASTAWPPATCLSMKAAVETEASSYHDGKWMSQRVKIGQPHHGGSMEASLDWKDEKETPASYRPCHHATIGAVHQHQDQGVGLTGGIQS